MIETVIRDTQRFCDDRAFARRRLLFAISLVFSGIPIASAQDKKSLPSIGVLFTGSATTARSSAIALAEGLRELGYIDGQTAHILVRFADGSIQRAHAQANEFARAKVNVIIASNGEATEAARRAAPGTPIVCATCGDFIGSEFAASLARPGGNITGTTIMSPATNEKRIQLLAEIVPKLRRLAIVVVPGISRTTTLQLEEIEQTGNKLGVESRAFINQGTESFEQLANELRAWRAEAMLIMESPRNALHRKDLGDLALRLKLPAIAGELRYAEAGVLLSYGTNYDANYRRTAYFVDRILKGAKPGDLPIEQPTRFELVANLKTAKAIGVTLPQSILVWADRLIQ